MDFSSDVHFATDELATRFIEEIDFDYQQLDATAVLLTATSRAQRNPDPSGLTAAS